MPLCLQWSYLVGLLTGVQEYHPGGDLEGLLRIYGYFPPPAARIYTAEIVCFFYLAAYLV